MDPKKDIDIKEDYIDPPPAHFGHEPQKRPKTNPWQIVFILLLFIFVVTAAFFRSGFFITNVSKIIPTPSPAQEITPCGTCPQLMPPHPDFCKDGTIVPGEIDECGCQQPPVCVTPTPQEKCLPYVNPCDPQSCDYDPQKCQ